MVLILSGAFRGQLVEAGEYLVEEGHYLVSVSSSAMWVKPTAPANITEHRQNRRLSCPAGA